MGDTGSEIIQVPEIIPLIPLRDLIIFPNLVVPLFVGRERSMRALEAAMHGDRVVALVTQRDAETAEPSPEDLYQVGSAASLMQELKLPDGTAKALVEGVSRIKIEEFVQFEPYFTVRVSQFDEKIEHSNEIEALMRNLIGQFEESARLGKPVPQEVILASQNIDEPGRLADFVAFHLNLRSDEKQQILEAVEPRLRVELVSGFLNKEIEILEIGSRIQSRVREQMTKTQREYFLREQLKAIQKELGAADEQEEEIQELRLKIDEAGMPEEANEKALKELSRLQKMPSAAAETGVIRTYLDWLISIPWDQASEEKLNLKEAKKILDADHYGLEKVKERVLEFLAVHKLTNKLKGPILCFVGPPGTGKTSIGRSIAKALNRKFIRVSLGGIHDEAEIRGHRRTYVGALPGRIVQSIAQVSTNNPVFMMDEVDKVGMDFRGDPTSALLEVLDPEQNYAFSDHYLEVPLDLSNVMFITTANLLDPIPPALKDRMEVINFAGYTEEEKVKIAENFLIKKQREAHGIKPEYLTITNEAVRGIVQNYTREAGVRNLERKIATICRQVARKIVERKTKSVTLTAENLHEFLGPIQVRYGLAEEKNEIGVATGLAWTEVGGDVMSIEAAVLPGKGELLLTGRLGDVMQESAQAGMSYIRSRAAALGIDPDFNKHSDIHIHIPGGAIPKDGPSAGITMATALVSALTKKKVNRKVAMTGEITLRGRVLPVGGLKEKILAAHRSGVKKIILPAENDRDIELVPKQVRRELKFILVENMDQVLEHALANGFKVTPHKKAAAAAAQRKIAGAAST